MSELKNRITARENSGATVGPRARMNFIPGIGTTVTVTDDSTDDEVDVTINSTAGTAGMTVADYIVFESGLSYIAIDGNTGLTMTSGADFTTVMHTVIAAATAGDVIYIKNGTYTVASAIIVNKTLSIIGAGWETDLVANNNFTAIFSISASYCYFAHMTLNASNLAAYAVHMNGGIRNEFYHVDMCYGRLDTVNVAYAIAGRGSHKFDRCIIRNAGRHGIYFGTYEYDCWVTGCTVRNNANGGITIDASGIQCMNNHVWGNQYGYLLANGAVITRVSINGDYVENNTDANIYNAGACYSTYQITVSGCIFWSLTLGNPEYDIQLGPTVGYSQYWSITGNSFVGQNFANYGIYLGTNARYCTITGNNFDDFITTPIYIGNSHNVINNNVGFRTEEHGTGLFDTSLTPTTTIVSHHCDYTPHRGDINIQFATRPAVDPGFIYISAVSSTEIEFSLFTNPAGNLGFYWSIRRTVLGI